jgi:hypothetical protein
VRGNIIHCSNECMETELQGYYILHVCTKELLAESERAISATVPHGHGLRQQVQIHCYRGVTDRYQSWQSAQPGMVLSDQAYHLTENMLNLACKSPAEHNRSIQNNVSKFLKINGLMYLKDLTLVPFVSCFPTFKVNSCLTYHQPTATHCTKYYASISTR